MEKVMAIKNLKKIYGVHGPNPKVAINDISLQIDQGILFVLWDLQVLGKQH